LNFDHFARLSSGVGNFLNAGDTSEVDVSHPLAAHERLLAQLKSDFQRSVAQCEALLLHRRLVLVGACGVNCRLKSLQQNIFNLSVAWPKPIGIKLIKFAGNSMHVNKSFLNRIVGSPDDCRTKGINF